MEFLKLFLLMLWPPYFYKMVKTCFSSHRSPGWGGAIETLMAPFILLLALCVVAAWVCIIAGVVALVQHTSVSFH